MKSRRIVDEDLFESLTEAIKHVAEGAEGGEVRVQSWRVISLNEKKLAEQAKVKLVSTGKDGEPIEKKEVAAFNHLTDPICWSHHITYDDGEAETLIERRRVADLKDEDVVYAMPIDEASIMRAAWEESIQVGDQDGASMRYDPRHGIWFLGRDQIPLTTAQIVNTVSNSGMYRSAKKQRVVGGYGTVSMKEEGSD